MKTYQIAIIGILILLSVGSAIYVLTGSDSITSEDLAKLPTTAVSSAQSNVGKQPASGNRLDVSSSDLDKLASAVSESAGVDEEKLAEDIREKSMQDMLENLVKKSIEEGKSANSSKKTGDGTDSSGGDSAQASKSKDSTADVSFKNKFKKDKDDKLARKGGLDRVSEAEIKSMVEEAKRALESGDYEKAKQLLEKTLELDPTAREALRAMANLYKKMGDFQGELDAYQKWINANPGDPTPHYLMADAYRRQGKYDLAYNELQIFEQMSGNKSSTYAMSAGMYRQLGMKEEEYRALMNWVNHDPNSPEARISLGDYYRRMGDYNSAIAQYQSAIALAPGNINNYVSISSMYSKIGMYAQAEDYLYRAFQLQPNNSTVQILLAQNYIRQGDIANAIWMYQYILQNNPDPNIRAQAERALQRLENQTAKNR